MQRQPTLPTADIIKQARTKSGLSQGDFGHTLGKSQGVISRYEKGTVTPPGDVLMHCMNILRGDVHPPSANDPGNDPGWDTVMAALDSLSSAIRGMRQQGLRPAGHSNRNRNR
ncbi:multiprotein-bridging factor 1 family protein [Luteibacter sp. RCC_6_2]|uniref:helix-turn-helix domain-containing protein n=1 Tax=Luteibacter sp. RCC_6_2 TaxID=3239223 RepID=UPI003523C2F9